MIDSQSRSMIGDAFRQLQDEASSTAREHGFWETNTNFGELIALIVTETAEAFECYRDDEMTITYASSGKPEGMPVEIADIVIRCLDVAGRYNFDLGAVIMQKMEYNRSRPYLHGRVR